MDGSNSEFELSSEEASDQEGRNFSSETSISDTTDDEQAKDIDELLSVGHPVFLNCAIRNPKHHLKVS